VCSRSSFIILQAIGIQEALLTDGYVVIPGVVPEDIVVVAARAVRKRVKDLLTYWDMKPGRNFEGILDPKVNWGKSPRGWPGLPLGGVKSRGWQKGSGAGRNAESFPNDSTFQSLVTVAITALQLELYEHVCS
jgi:hypothetical protein